MVVERPPTALPQESFTVSGKMSPYRCITTSDLSTFSAFEASANGEDRERRRNRRVDEDDLSRVNESISGLESVLDLLGLVVPPAKFVFLIRVHCSQMGGDVGWGDGILAFLTNEDLILPDVHKEMVDFRSHDGERKAGKGDRALGGRGKSQNNAS